MVSPIVAAIISFFFPGIGQVVQGETQKGIIMFVAAIVISIILAYALGTCLLYTSPSPRDCS